MPTVAAIAARIAREGEPCTLTRPGTTPVSVDVQAFVRGYKPEELIAGSGIIQGDRLAIISDREIAAAGWPGPPKPKDWLIIGGKTTSVQSVETRLFRGATAMHLIQVRGG